MNPFKPSLSFKIQSKIREYRKQHDKFNSWLTKISYKWSKIQNFFWGIYSCIITSYKYMTQKYLTTKENIRKQKIANVFTKNHLMKTSIEKRRQKLLNEIKKGPNNENLPQISGDDPEEYDESCILSLKKNMENK